MLSLGHGPAVKAVTGVGLAAVLMGTMVEPVAAWPIPLVGVAGGDCRADGTRQPVYWVVTNLESHFPRSPATIDNVSFSPAFPRTVFDPAILENTGSASAVTRMSIPALWVGTVYFTGRMFWDGEDGSDIRAMSGSYAVPFCFPPALQAKRVGRPRPAIRVTFGAR